MNLGKAIKELRKERGFNQSDMAKTMGITQTALSQIESGAKRPNSGTMKKLTDFFQIPELLIYLLATESIDIPEQKQKMFEDIFPDVKNLLLNIFSDQKPKT